MIIKYVLNAILVTFYFHDPIIGKNILHNIATLPEHIHDKALLTELLPQNLAKGSFSINQDDKYTTICWKEITTLRFYPNGTNVGYVQYAISMESTPEAPFENLSNNTIRTPYEMYDPETNTSRVLDFVVVRSTTDEIVKENTTTKCRSDKTYYTISKNGNNGHKVVVKVKPVLQEIRDSSKQATFTTTTQSEYGDFVGRSGQFQVEDTLPPSLNNSTRQMETTTFATNNSHTLSENQLTVTMSPKSAQPENQLAVTMSPKSVQPLTTGENKQQYKKSISDTTSRKTEPSTMKSVKQAVPGISTPKPTQHQSKKLNFPTQKKNTIVTNNDVKWQNQFSTSNKQTKQKDASNRSFSTLAKALTASSEQEPSEINNVPSHESIELLAPTDPSSYENIDSTPIRTKCSSNRTVQIKLKLTVEDDVGVIKNLRKKLNIDITLPQNTYMHDDYFDEELIRLLLQFFRKDMLRAKCFHSDAPRQLDVPRNAHGQRPDMNAFQRPGGQYYARPNGYAPSFLEGFAEKVQQALANLVH